MIAGGRGSQQLCSLSDSPGGTDISSNQETYQPGETEMGSGTSEIQDGFLRPGQRSRFKCRTDRRPCLCSCAPNYKLCRRKREVCLMEQVFLDKTLHKKLLKNIIFTIFFLYWKFYPHTHTYIWDNHWKINTPKLGNYFKNKPKI